MTFPKEKSIGFYRYPIKIHIYICNAVCYTVTDE